MSHSETITANLKFLRHSHNYTRQQICNLLGIGVRTWDSYTEGRAAPKLETLVSIADYFRITLDELVRVDLQKCYVVRENKYMEKLIIEQ